MAVKGKRLGPVEIDDKSFLRAICGKMKGYHAPLQKAAMGEDSGVIGGYLVPQEYSIALMDSLEENAIFRPRCRVVPMGSLETIAPAPDMPTVTGKTPFIGGMQMTWGSGTTLNQSEPSFRGVSLKACDMIGLAETSNQFVADLTPEGEMALMALFGKAVAWYEDYVFINGLGAGNSQPLGILNAPAALPVARAGANAIAIADVSGMTAKLIPYSWPRSIWLTSPSALAQLFKLTGFQPNSVVLDPFEGFEGFAGFLMARPVFVTEKVGALGSRGDLVLFDPSLYVIGDRMETVIDSSIHPLFTTNKTVFRIWRRVDGRPVMDTYVTLADGQTASSIVVLAA